MNVIHKLNCLERGDLCAICGMGDDARAPGPIHYNESYRRFKSKLPDTVLCEDTPAGVLFGVHES